MTNGCLGTVATVGVDEGVTRPPQSPTGIGPTASGGAAGGRSKQPRRRRDRFRRHAAARHWRRARLPFVAGRLRRSRSPRRQGAHARCARPRFIGRSHRPERECWISIKGEDTSADLRSESDKRCVHVCRQRLQPLDCRVGVGDRATALRGPQECSALRAQAMRNLRPWLADQKHSCARRSIATSLEAFDLLQRNDLVLHGPTTTTDSAVILTRERQIPPARRPAAQPVGT